MAVNGEQRPDDDEAGAAGEWPGPPKPWTANAQMAGAILWPSFLAASLATMLFFAFVDPEHIHEFTTPPLELTRMAAYGAGFFFFWFVAATSSAVSAYLLRTARPDLRADTDRERNP